MAREIRTDGFNDAFELTREQKEAIRASQKRQGRSFPLIIPPSARAVLLERDNPEEFLEFHWNPDSYSIAKNAKWSEEAVTGGTSTVNYNGCGATRISFEAFFNDIGQPEDRPRQRSAEESISWLHRRLRPRTMDEAASGRGRDRRVGLDWLNVRDPSSPAMPPVMVLFGLRGPFECVLKSANVVTIFQRGRVLPPDAQAINARNRFADAGVAGARQSTSPERAAEIQRASGGDITRARVQIVLWEFTNDPDAGS